MLLFKFTRCFLKFSNIEKDEFSLGIDKYFVILKLRAKTNKTLQKDLFSLKYICVYVCSVMSQLFSLIYAMIIFNRNLIIIMAENPKK